MRCAGAAQEKREATATPPAAPMVVKNVLRFIEASTIRVGRLSIAAVKKCALGGSGEPPTLRRIRVRQQFFPDVFKYVQSALHAYFARQNRVFVFHAEYTVEADFHVGAHNVFPLGS